MVSFFLRDTCTIIERVLEDVDNPYGRQEYSNREIITLKCLYDPRVVRSNEGIAPTSRPHDEEVTFFTEYPADPDIIRDDMFVLYKGTTYRIKYVNDMEALVEMGIGSHLEICTKRDTNV